MLDAHSSRYLGIWVPGYLPRPGRCLHIRVPVRYHGLGQTYGVVARPASSFPTKGPRRRSQGSEASNHDRTSSFNPTAPANGLIRRARARPDNLLHVDDGPRTLAGPPSTPTMAESSALSASKNPFRRPSTAGPGPGPGSSRPALSPSVFDSLSHPSTPTAGEFRARLQSLPPASLPPPPPPPTGLQKTKVVKKVRVQSPPPSSPESPAATPGAFAPQWASSRQHPADVDASDHGAVRWHPPALGVNSDHNGARAGQPQTRKTPAMDVTAFSRLLMTGQQDSSMTPSQFAPLSKTYRGAALTGVSGSVADASSVSRQSLFDASQVLSETRRTSHDMSDAGDEEVRPYDMVGGGQGRKEKPAPPNSRHGKLINLELQGGGEGPRTQTWPSTGWQATLSDVNKPLPPAPGRFRANGSSESCFEREAVGKMSEPAVGQDAVDLPLPRLPTPPQTSHSQTETASITGRANKKPLPPPRRNHARAESRSSVSALPSPGAGLTSSARDEGTTPSRSSLDSTRSRSSSLRVSNSAPVPPPSRRPNPGARASMIITSPSAPSLTSLALSSSSSSEKDAAATDSLPFQESLSARLTAAEAAAQTADTSSATSPALTRSTSGLLASSQGGASRILPPPPPAPPPARNASVRSRKPPSVSSLEAATVRRASRDSLLSSGPTPPPPPARHRGGSRGSRSSADWSGVQSRRASVGSVLQVPVGGGAVGDAGEEPGEEPEPVPLESIVSADSSHSAAHDILADLDALQREVDALRAQHEGAPGGGTGAA